MYKYEMHCHTSPVSACARATAEQTVEFYKSLGYDGVFITNHFLDGNIGGDRSAPYEEQIEFYCSDYEKAKEHGEKIGIKVFFGIEASYKGTDFLVYGLDKDWFLKNPQIMDMTVKEKLGLMRESGGLVFQAHPFRESKHIDHIRLFPQSVDGIEVINANRSEYENQTSKIYAERYGFKFLAGSDNHIGKRQKSLAGIESVYPINSVEDFILGIEKDSFSLFEINLEETEI